MTIQKPTCREECDEIWFSCQVSLQKGQEMTLSIAERGWGMLNNQTNMFTFSEVFCFCMSYVSDIPFL